MLKVYRSDNGGKKTFYNILLMLTLMAQTVKNLPYSVEDLGSILGQEDPLEKEMATHSIILAWEIPWKEEPGKGKFMELQRVRNN